MSTDRPSPFTIPNPTFKFAEGPPSQPIPPQPVTVDQLVRSLIDFADFYEVATAAIRNAAHLEKQHALGDRDANADYQQRVFRAMVAIERVRAYVLAKYGDELTIGTARRLLGDLIRECGLSVEAAGALTLSSAMDRLEGTDAPGRSPKSKRSPGRKPKYDPAKDRAFVKDWERARAIGVSFKDFCSDHKVKVKEGEKIKARVRGRKK